MKRPKTREESRTISEMFGHKIRQGGHPSHVDTSTWNCYPDDVLNFKLLAASTYFCRRCGKITAHETDTGYHILDSPCQGNLENTVAGNYLSELEDAERENGERLTFNNQRGIWLKVKRETR